MEEHVQQQVEQPIRHADDFPIVAIGASAGGLDSLERLFANLPTDTGMAFVVLQHLSPDFKSLMDELLSRRTPMPIRQADHDMPLEPNTIYLLPPMKEMIVRGRRLLLNDRDPRHGLTLPIDMFFRSLAQDAGERAVAVVLSGSGSDGSRGVTEIKKAGGTVICESPDTAQFNGMPLSAIRTTMVDQVLPPEEIALALAEFGKPEKHRSPLDSASDDDRGVDAIMRLLRDEYAIDFSHYKASTVTRRIERRLALNRSLDIDMYVEQLRSDPRELSSLYEDLLIGVTRFFRDDTAFEALEHRIIPEIVERATPDGQVRVWVAGCATGQEAYSIVEDQADARLMMQLVLESQGVTVSTAENGKDGIGLIEQLRPDLALVDLGLPVLSGFEVARHVRKDPAYNRTRLVALSGYGQDADVGAALGAGFDEHLTKPVDLDRLEQILRGGASASRDGQPS